VHQRATTADIGLSPTAVRVLAVVSRATGLAGEVSEERPVATDIWQHVDDDTGSPERGARQSAVRRNALRSSTNRSGTSMAAK